MSTKREFCNELSGKNCGGQSSERMALNLRKREPHQEEEVEEKAGGNMATARWILLGVQAEGLRDKPPFRVPPDDATVCRWRRARAAQLGTQERRLDRQPRRRCFRLNPEEKPPRCRHCLTCLFFHLLILRRLLLAPAQRHYFGGLSTTLLHRHLIAIHIRFFALVA